MYLIIMSLHYVCTCMFVLFDNWDLLMFCVYMYICIYVYNAKQKQPGCKKSARPIRSHNGYKRPKTLISSKAKKLNILLRIHLLE